LADARREEIGVSEGISEAVRASTRECDDRIVAANARTDKLTIIVRCRAGDIGMLIDSGLRRGERGVHMSLYFFRRDLA
jgi:hypothetical protein